jgi:hypothetical protein
MGMAMSCGKETIDALENLWREISARAVNEDNVYLAGEANGLSRALNLLGRGKLGEVD